MSISGYLAPFALVRKVALSLTLAAVFTIGPAANTHASDRNNPSPEPGAAAPPLIEIFDETLPPEAVWQAKQPEKIVRQSRGYAGERWAYMQTRDGKISITGLSIRIRENPQPGQYRYLSFAWQKWGGGQIALQIDTDDTKDARRKRGELYGYRFDAGEGPPVEGLALRLSQAVPSQWTEVTRDLWQDFGDFTITGLTFISIQGRDAAFDRIYLARAQSNFEAMPPSYRQAALIEELGQEAQASPTAPILPAQVAEPMDLNALNDAATDPRTDDPPVVLHSDVDTQKVFIDWGGQIMAGGWTMIPLLVLSVAGVVIGVQRMLTVRESLIAPAQLLPAVRRAMADGDTQTALDQCDRHPSTLAESLRFVIEHRQNDIQVVNQAAGDIAARDIRDHMSRIYPLSVIGALAPLLGLLGTIIGMIEAFALVAIYGDEGGATILSGSISKALITTAAGLIIAIPAIAMYYVIKNRLMRITSLIEIALEDLIASVYLKKDAEPEK